MPSGGIELPTARTSRQYGFFREMSKDPCLRQGFRPTAESSASGRNFFSYREFPNFLKKTAKTNPRPKCIGGFNHRRNLQKLVSMPFWKVNYFFKKIWKKKKFFFFFFFFFLKFLKKKSTPAPKKTLLLPNLAKKTPKTNPRPKYRGGFHYRENLQKIVSMPFGKGNYV